MIIYDNWRSCACKLKYLLLYKWFWIFFTLSKKWVGRAMGNKTFYGDGLTVYIFHLHFPTGVYEYSVSLNKCIFCLAYHAILVILKLDYWVCQVYIEIYYMLIVEQSSWHELTSTHIRMYYLQDQSSKRVCKTISELLFVHYFLEKHLHTNKTWGQL